RVVAVRDITERREAEKALADNEARTRAIIDGAHDAIITIDEGGAVVEFNPAAETIFGRSRESVLGQRVEDVIAAESHGGSDGAGFDRYLAAGERRLAGGRVEVEALRADGSRFPAELT